MWPKTKKVIKNTHNNNNNNRISRNNYTDYDKHVLKKQMDQTQFYTNKKPSAKQTCKNPIVSENYIMNNIEVYGEVQEDTENNSTHVYLFRHDVAVTQHEIDIENESLYPIDLQWNKMFRCPLQSCKHKPLNNYYIQSHLKNHCDIYHKNDNKQYFFYFQNEFGWVQVEYPPVEYPPVENSAYKTNLVEYPPLEKNYNKNSIVSQNYIMNNTEKYGKVQQDKKNNKTHIYLYRHQLALTQNEIKIQNESLYPINYKQNTMFRCPLQSCKHQPLNNYYVEKHLKNHCEIYHNKDNRQYIFYFQRDYEWKQVEYPPLQKKYENIIVSEEYIMNNSELYGDVLEDEYHNTIYIFLYPHDITLTQNEIDLQNYSPYPIDVELNKMFRCPLQSCKHKPLNNYFIESDLLQHCQIYHHNENKQYIFCFETQLHWRELQYPPILSTDTNPSFQNNN